MPWASTKSKPRCSPARRPKARATTWYPAASTTASSTPRSEEHTSELQSRLHLVCRLLLEKKKNFIHNLHTKKNSYISLKGRIEMRVTSYTEQQLSDHQRYERA